MINQGIVQGPHQNYRNHRLKTQQRLFVKVFFGQGYSRFISQHKCSLLDEYCLYVRIQDSCICHNKGQSLAGKHTLNSSSVKKTQLNQEEKQEEENLALRFHPLSVLGSSRYNLDTVSPASKSQDCHCSRNPNLHRLS